MLFHTVIIPRMSRPRDRRQGILKTSRPKGQWQGVPKMFRPKGQWQGIPRMSRPKGQRQGIPKTFHPKGQRWDILTHIQANRHQPGIVGPPMCLPMDCSGERTLESKGRLKG